MVVLLCTILHHVFKPPNDDLLYIINTCTNKFSGLITIESAHFFCIVSPFRSFVLHVKSTLPKCIMSQAIIAQWCCEEGCNHPISVFYFGINQYELIKSLENSWTEIFLRLIFPKSSKVFFEPGKYEKVTRGNIWQILGLRKLGTLFLFQIFLVIGCFVWRSIVLQQPNTTETNYFNNLWRTLH
jgi:hypothetical protein